MLDPYKPADVAVLYRVLRGWRDGLTELLLFAAVWLAAGLYLVPEPGRAAWLLTLPLLALCGAGLAYWTKHRWLRLLAALAPAAAHGAAFGSAQPAWGMALLAVAAYIAVLRGAAAPGAAARANAVRRYAIGIACYGVGSILASRLPEWTPYVPLLAAMGVLSLAILLFALNRRLLQRETLSSDRGAVTASTRGHNRLFVAVTLAAVLVITALAAGAIGHGLWSLVRSVLAWLFTGHSEPPPPPLQEAPRPAAPPPPLPAGERSWLGSVLDALLYGIGAAFVIAVAWLALREVYRRRHAIIRSIARVFARLAAFLGRAHPHEVDTGYVDEETELLPAERLNAGKPGKGWLGRLAARLAGRERWEDQADNRARIRYLYRQWLRLLKERGGAVPPNLTPEELRLQASDPGTAELIRAYYKARYSDGDITDAELDAAASKSNPRSL